MFSIEQGDILKVENIKGHVLVVSKKFFTRSESAFLCPIAAAASPDPLHIKIAADDFSGVVLCEDVK